jgi:hypothetical protein
MRQRIALTDTVRKRYRASSKKRKSEILTELVETTGYNRSYARLVLGSRKKVGRKKKYAPRKRTYDATVFYALRKLWIATDCICSQRLQPFIPELLQVLDKNKEITCSNGVKKKVCHMSSATIDRMLQATKKSYELKGRSTTKPGTLLRQTVAVRTFDDWSDTRPGFFEVDTVAFCGDSVRGEYVCGLDVTDVATGWVGLDAVMGKGQQHIHDAIDAFRHRLAFPLLGLDPDNGSEFINWILKRYCETNRIVFTRIRPYKKNDNCYVEQKNYTTLRRFIGYGRYETEEQLVLIRQILVVAEPYVNFFQPCKKLKEKQRIGSRVKKTYYTAQTPYQRLLASGILNEEQKQKLQAYYETLNPMALLRKIRTVQRKLQKTLR